MKLEVENPEAFKDDFAQIAFAQEDRCSDPKKRSDDERQERSVESSPDLGKYAVARFVGIPRGTVNEIQTIFPESRYGSERNLQDKPSDQEDGEDREGKAQAAERNVVPSLGLRWRLPDLPRIPAGRFRAKFGAPCRDGCHNLLRPLRLKLENSLRNIFCRRLYLRNNLGRQRNVAERFRFLLTVCQTVVDQITKGFGLRLVVVLFVEQHPRIGNNRVGIFAVGVGNPGN